MSATYFFKNGNFLGLLLASTVLGSVMPMLIILGGLSGLMLAPTPALATIPASIQTLAGLLTAAPFSLLMGRFGRSNGFLIGAVLAIIGALTGVWALVSGSFLLLCLSHFVLGAALTSYQYFRFAAAEVVTPEWRPVAISLMLTSGLVAAFAGPQFFIMAKDALAPVPLAGAYAMIAVVTLVGLIPLLRVRIPALADERGAKQGGWATARAILHNGPVRTAVATGAVSQGIMVFLMVPTPLAMIGCGFSEALAGDVIRWHVVAMFAPSFFTGFLIKRFGTRRIAGLGLIFLISAAALAASGLSASHFYASLVLLGVGWNFGFIGATSMLAQVVPTQEKSVVQGVNDTIIALTSTVCAFAAGAVIAGYGWPLLALAAMCILLVALVALVLDKSEVGNGPA